MTREEATEIAADLLEDEANSLALILHETDTKLLTHRVRVAIQRELRRFRDAANALKDGKGQEQTEA